MELLITILIGLFIGFLSGMFGVGGALVGTPILNLFLGLPELLAVATPLPAAIPSAVSGSIAYSRKKLVRFDIARRALAFALPVNILGALLTKVIPGSVLLVLTGITLAYISWTSIRRGWKKVPQGREQADLASEEPGRERWLPVYLGGALAGLVSGFLAIGGGIVLVPIFTDLLKMPTKQALATSLFCVAALAIPGVAVHGWLGHIDWEIALVLSLAVIPASYAGARVSTSLRTPLLEKIYGVTMLLFAIFFTIRTLMR